MGGTDLVKYNLTSGFSSPTYAPHEDTRPGLQMHVICADLKLLADLELLAKLFVDYFKKSSVDFFDFVVLLFLT